MKRQNRTKYVDKIIRSTNNKLKPIYRNTAIGIRDAASRLYLETGSVDIQNLRKHAGWIELENQILMNCQDIYDSEYRLLSREFSNVYTNVRQYAYKEIQKEVEASAVNSVLTTEKTIRNRLLLDMQPYKKSTIEGVWCKDGYKWSERLWKNQTTLAHTLKADIFSCYENNVPIVELEKKIMKDFNVKYHEASRLVRTELSHIETATTCQLYREYGYTKARWVAESGCCEKCYFNDGALLSLTELEELIPAHPNCRCTIGRPEKQEFGL